MADLTREELKKRLDSSERRRSSLQRALLRNGAEEDNLFWSMADLMTLLLVFFVLFYSHAITIKPEVIQVLTKPQPIVVPEATESLPTPPRSSTEAPVPKADESEIVASAATAEESQGMEEIEQEALQAIDDSEAQHISVRRRNNQLVFVLAEQITFNVGEAKLIEEFQPALSRIATFIAGKNGYRVAVSGHTDDAPIHTPLFPSNWELSAARAVTVARFLIMNAVPSSRISIQVYAEYKPLYENTTPENRQSNRRVEIALIREQKSE
jgi:chemotaxis protein MotB